MIPLSLIIIGCALIVLLIIHIIFLLMVINRSPMIMAKIHADNNTCKGISGLVFGHSYEAVFEYQECFPENFDPVEAICKIDPGHLFEEVQVGRLIKKFKEEKKIYKHHVCQKCGHVVQETK